MGAEKKIASPSSRPVTTIIRQALVNMLLASASFFSPSRTEIGTADPTPIRSASEKLMITSGIARFRAAKASPASIRPTRTPSMVWYRAEASMPTEPGIAARKNSFTAGVFENNSL